MRVQIRFSLTLLAFSFFASVAVAQYKSYRKLKRTIETEIKGAHATVGVALLDLSTGDSLTINARHHFPMQSVFKFPLAMAIFKLVEDGKMSLDQKVHISKDQYIPGTFGPMAKLYPEGNIDLTLSEILRYTVSESDNNACDLLFSLSGGTGFTQSYVHELGVKDIAIVANEREMAVGDVQYNNWCTPLAMAQLLKIAFTTNTLQQNHRALLHQWMTDTPTGKHRLKGELPTEVVVTHKTGTSSTNENGITAAINDAGIIKLPNGKTFALVVLVSDSKENMHTNEKIISAIAKKVYDHYISNP